MTTLVNVAVRCLLLGLAVLLASACSSPSTLTPAEQAELPGDHIVVIGDSYTMGPEDNGKDPDVWPALVWDQLRSKGYDIQPTVLGEGGSGYVHKGYRGDQFADKISAIPSSADLVVFVGGANDMDIPPDFERKIVGETFKSVRLAAPKAKMLVVGPAWPNGKDVPSEVLRVRDIVRDQAAVVGATFVDPLEQRWLWDDPNLIGPDWIHPNRAGQQYLAQKMLPLIQAQLPPPGKA